MEICKGIRIHRNSLLVGKTLAIADLHLGQDESMTKKGVLIPKFQFRDIGKELMMIIEKKQPEELAITGDLKHEFGSILDTEWRNIIKLFDMILAKCKLVTVLKGNHDVMLWPIAKKANVQIKESLLLGKVLLIHGDIVPPKELLGKAEIIIMGHEHPAISLTKDNRVERFKCFLKGEYKKKILIVMPSFNPLTAGTDVLYEKMLSPLLKGSLDEFEVFVPSENEVLYFGKIKDLRKKL